jgi:PEGA domain
VAILKIPRLWPSLQRSGVAAVAAGVADSGDGLDAFGSESAPAPSVPAGGSRHPRGFKAPVSALFIATIAKWTVVILLSAAVATAAVLEYQRRVPSAGATGSLSLETTPAGVDIVIAGKTVGRTPMTLSLSPGTYDVQLGSGESARTIRASVLSGASTVQHVEMPNAAQAAAALLGALRIHTEPSKLPVFIDGIERGRSPLTIEGVTPGDHEVTVKGPRGVVKRSVTLKERETVSLIVSSAIAPAADAPPAMAAGWLSVTSPITLQMREGGKIIGSTESERVMLPAGDHDIDFSNDALGFQTQRRLKVAAGKSTAARIEVPNGAVSLNATPWAEVFIDGQRVGETPIGNLSRPIGRHDVLFRHPEFGERRETIMVTVGQTARLGVDLRKK